MPTVVIDGIATRYEVIGSGPPLLMYAPGGFNAVVEAWSTLGIYARNKAARSSAGSISPASCSTAANAANRAAGSSRSPGSISSRRAKDCSSICGIARAHLMGGCMGCAPVAAFAVAHPETVASMILYWPVGGAKYRISSHQRFAEHLAFVARERARSRGRRWCARKASHSAPIRAAARGLPSLKTTRLLPPPMPPRFATIRRNLRGHARCSVRPRHRARRRARSN